MMHKDSMGLYLFLAHLGLSFYLTGLVWVIQVVHYPLFAVVGADSFSAYEAQHVKRITWIVAGPMIVELMTALMMYVERPVFVKNYEVIGVIVVVGLIWLNTFLQAVPAHNQLADKFTPDAHHSLLIANWIRTGLWTLKSLFLLYLLSRALSPPQV